MQLFVAVNGDKRIARVTRSKADIAALKQLTQQGWTVTKATNEQAAEIVSALTHKEA